MCDLKCIFLITVILPLSYLLTDPAYVCYPKVGCFDKTHPWNTIPVPLPVCPCNISTFMFYYNREQPDGVQFSIYRRINTSFEFMNKTETFVIIHGYFGDGRLPWIIKMKDTLLQRQNANILVVDYGLQLFSYTQTIGNGRVVARLLQNVVETLRIPVRSLHIIGHSLGAQFASFLAENYRETGKKIARITGLDPAGPIFQTSSFQVRLDKTDANFVDILHTNPGQLGELNPIADIDFYFNGILLQPGCLNRPDPIVCSHNRSVDYFQEAIEKQCCLFGYPAEFKTPENVTLLPEVVQTKNQPRIPVGLETIAYKQRGIFFVTTQPNSPFCHP